MSYSSSSKGSEHPRRQTRDKSPRSPPQKKAKPVAKPGSVGALASEVTVGTELANPSDPQGTVVSADAPVPLPLLVVEPMTIGGAGGRDRTETSTDSATASAEVVAESQEQAKDVQDNATSQAIAPSKQCESEGTSSGGDDVESPTKRLRIGEVLKMRGF